MYIFHKNEGVDLLKFNPEYLIYLSAFIVTCPVGITGYMLPHSKKRHCIDYHESALGEMEHAAREAGNDRDEFLRLFDLYIKTEVLKTLKWFENTIGGIRNDKILYGTLGSAGFQGLQKYWNCI